MVGNGAECAPGFENGNLICHRSGSETERCRHPFLSLGVRASWVLLLACLAVALVPGAVAVSEHRLEQAQDAFGRGDCAKAESEARRSLDVVGFRSQPRQVIAYCAARRQDMPTALSEIRHAIRDDPDYWRYRYDLALLLAADGQDGVPAARAAAALNPREPVAALAPRVLAGSNAASLARQQLTGGQ